MTIRKDMLRAAAQARKLLGDSTETVVDFAYSQLNPDGGFKSRGGQSDIYYSVFGIELFRSLNIELPCKSGCTFSFIFPFVFPAAEII